ncbi:MAG TPA: hypothetical protein GX406_00545 [Pseudoclavibacter sp.]|nr:hypothetical protein [Pseudoclavibacter sp.]
MSKPRSTAQLPSLFLLILIYLIGVGTLAAGIIFIFQGNGTIAQINVDQSSYTDSSALYGAYYGAQGVITLGGALATAGVVVVAIAIAVNILRLFAVSTAVDNSDVFDADLEISDVYREPVADQTEIENDPAAGEAIPEEQPAAVDEAAVPADQIPAEDAAAEQIPAAGDPSSSDKA